MSQSTVDALEAQRLSFFEDATRARGKYGEKESERKKPGYVWKKTPVPDTWTSNGAWIGLACISSGNKNKLIRQITKTVELPGSYYVGTPKNSNYAILVLPKLGLVVHNRNDPVIAPIKILKINRTESLGFADLDISNNQGGTKVLIRDTTNSNELLATVNNLDAADLTEVDFI